MLQANLLRLVVLSALLAGGTGWANGGANDPFSAERYYSSPMKFVGEKVKVRVFKIEPRPNLTAADLGYGFGGYCEFMFYGIGVGRSSS